MSDLCPWGDDEVDLRGVPLTLEQKRWFANEINENFLDPADLAKRFKLHVKTIVRYARMVREGGVLSEGLGRPKLLDIKCENELVKDLSNNVYQLDTENMRKPFMAKP